MKLIFERSVEGYINEMIPPCDVPLVDIPTEMKRQKSLQLPSLPQPEISRHYTELADATFGINNGFYPLGSCTMKYNPKINDEMAAYPNFANIHPLQPEHTVQGSLEVFTKTESLLKEITGMKAITFQPAAGAHGEFTSLLMIKAYHERNGQKQRNKIIVPDSAHGTNPASVAMTGMITVNIPSDKYGCVDIAALKEAVGEDTAGLMLTNPNTAGIFDKNILEITKIVHEAGGLNYYDGANLNAIMGVARPGDMGFDIIHLNLHKTFSTPHGGGGPGSGAVGCKELLKPFLPMYYPVVKDDKISFTQPEHSIGEVKGFYGQFSVFLRALTYILFLGSDGISSASKSAVLNANYMLHGLKDVFGIPYGESCMHEFVMSLDKLKKETGVTALDVAKGILDHKMYPPTMYFPLTVPEALMVEPSETEAKGRIDEAITVYRKLYETAHTNPEEFQEYPLYAQIHRVDEVRAARHPVVRFVFDEAEKK